MPLPSNVYLGVIGCGNLGQAIVTGLTEAGTLPPTHIFVSDRYPENSEAIAHKSGANSVSNLACVKASNIVILAVKPQTLPDLLLEISEAIEDTLVISVAAGVTTATIESHLGHQPRVVRAMPNMPAAIRQSATAIAAGAHTITEDIHLAQIIFESVGRVTLVDEPQLNAVTGLSGSGPAYVFLLIDAFADAGVNVGLPRAVATELAVQTILGAASMLQETQKHPGLLKDQVTSPGGTTIAGLHALEAGNLRATIMDAVAAATARAEALGDPSASAQR
ncbi:MAG: pyrroline-5-carboxylate reductase [Myxococcales bacterium]|nr:pyrroline-5-carboxylate reductase [Myxococcales bacterium]